MLVRTLSTLECTKLLTANRVGHLACAKDGQPYVVPFYYMRTIISMRFPCPARRSTGCEPTRLCRSRSTNAAKVEDGEA